MTARSCCGEDETEVKPEKNTSDFINFISFVTKCRHRLLAKTDVELFTICQSYAIIVFIQIVKDTFLSSSMKIWSFYIYGLANGMYHTHSTDVVWNIERDKCNLKKKN